MERWTMEDDDPDYVPSIDEDEEEDDDAEEDMDEEEQEHDLDVNIDEVDLDGSPAQDLLHTLVELHRLADQSDTQGARPSDATQLLVRLLGDEPLRPTRMPVSNVAAAPRAQVSDEEDEDEESDDEFDGYGLRGGTGSRRLPAWAGPTTEPQKAGMELLMGGEFGRVRNKINGRNVAKILASRATKTRKFYREDVLSNLVPNTNGTAVASYDSNIYCGQFSADSTFYYTCAQDFRLHIYDVTAPPQRTRPIHETRYRRMRPDHETTMKVMKTIPGHAGRWTITDSHLSPDNERIIYSSITPVVWMATTLDSSTTQKPINFSDRPIRDSDWDYDRFGIWSCRFSADGNEVIAGGNRRIFVYDLLADRRTVKIHAHDDDINSCCWADTASGNILISASDDTFIKVWDRRSLGSSPKPSGVFIGHTEGITNVSAKGDGRYIISNGKDQALRLWDLRKMRTNAEYEAVKHTSYGSPNFDYRYGSYPRLTRPAHPKDCSIMTYRGHTVLHTLIRCHFSPTETTGGQYIYSGSADGRVGGLVAADTQAGLGSACAHAEAVEVEVLAVGAVSLGRVHGPQTSRA
ncbi:hypothetical protein EWM64_g4307 [Hericium alpestre]|uniref:Uncharacterized protein n=1 Tax=Hericium alpestre TaxID=135208 RepID=A0A4Y9ZXU8_9AGAM|nr:hypothetical protein EWM64_g4307 [Hericium alpestre]